MGIGRAMAHTRKASLTYETPSRSVDATARIQVYFQGFLDDACFLYALANAYRALTGKRVTREHWSRAISQLPDPATFLGGAGATKLSHDVAEQLIEVVLGAFSGQGEIVTLKSLSPSAGIADFRDAVSSDSVVVFAYGGLLSSCTRRPISCAASRRATTRPRYTSHAQQLSPAATFSTASISSAIILPLIDGRTTPFLSIASW